MLTEDEICFESVALPSRDAKDADKRFEDAVHGTIEDAVEGTIEDAVDGSMGDAVDEGVWRSASKWIARLLRKGVEAEVESGKGVPLNRVGASNEEEFMSGAVFFGRAPGLLGVAKLFGPMELVGVVELVE